MREDWAVVYESRAYQPCSDRALVLHSLDIPYEIVRGLDRVALAVPASLAERAKFELWQYDQENRKKPPNRPLPLEHQNGIPGALAYVIVICLVAWMAGEGFLNRDWLSAGRVDGALIRAGEWWRTFTALTLHSGIRHLLGNLGFGALFGVLAGRLVGPGVAWLGILLAGAAGNALNTVLLESSHRSIGASTAVFAALGLLAGFVWRAKLMSQERWPYRLGPIVGGIALLAFTGTGDENTDIGAHLAGFVCGFAAGVALTLAATRLANGRLQFLCGLAAIAVLLAAWTTAFVAPEARHLGLQTCMHIQYPVMHGIGRSIDMTIHKGRGALSRTAGRFDKRSVEATEPEPSDQVAPQTVLKAMQVRRIISHNESPDVPFDRSINPYMGCEHGCIYCYARPSHSFLDLSPGLDFETRIFYKPNAVSALVAEWQKPGYVCKPITIGANTDPYQPAEKRLGITRQLLEAFLEHRHPVSLISKGGLMRRDLDLLSELAALGLCSVAISVPTANNELKRRLEPRVPSADVRFRLIETLASNGVPTSLLMAPIIPAVNDCEIEDIVSRAASSGVRRASYVLLRLPFELKGIFTEWLEGHMPDRASHVMSLVRQASGGKEYDHRFGVRQSGRGAYADMIAQRFRVACSKSGIPQARSQDDLDCDRFIPPGQSQLALPFTN